MAPFRTIFALLLSLGAASAFAPVNLAVRKQTRYVYNVISFALEDSSKY
jgi:hypothetical protein